MVRSCQSSLLASLSKIALEIQFYNCIATERAQWSTVGKAEFIGEPWVYSWAVTQEWDNAKGEWVQIIPLHHQLKVPGESLEVTLEDGTRFAYGEPLTEDNRGIWADNLYSIKTYAMANVPGPYVVIKRTDGAVYLLNVKEDGSCKVGWNLGHID